MRKVLILGASGFIGSNLVEKMYSKGYELSVILRDYSKAGFISGLDKSSITPNLVIKTIRGDVSKECFIN